MAGPTRRAPQPDDPLAEALRSVTDATPSSYEEAAAGLERMAQMAFGFLQFAPARTSGAAPRAVEPPPAAPEQESGVVVIDEAGTIVSFNEAAEHMFQQPAADVLGTNVSGLLAASLGDKLLGLLGRLRPGGPAAHLAGEAEGVRKDRTKFPMRASASELHVNGRRLTVLVLQDVGDRLQADAKLRAAEARYRALVEQIPAVTFMAALEGGANELYVSPQIEELLGYTQVEWLADPVLWYRRLHPDDRAAANAEFLRGCLNGGHFRTEVRFWSKAERIVWVHAEANVIRDGDGRPLYLQGVMFDITDIKQAEHVVRESLKEKEVLLKEIHHRVKNNMQVISSLLKLQSAYVQDPAALRLFQESQNRIRTMALVHEKLYQSGNQSEIDFAEYARSLATMVFRSSGGQAAGVTQRIEVEHVPLSLDLAVPCGLILNELLTNCLKHAFAPGQKGEVRIAFRRVEEDYELSVRDNGQGLPADLDWQNTSSLGLQLVRTLSDQLDGTLSLHREGGTEFRVRFGQPAGG